MNLDVMNLSWMEQAGWERVYGWCLPQRICHHKVLLFLPVAVVWELGKISLCSLNFVELDFQLS